MMVGKQWVKRLRLTSQFNDSTSHYFGVNEVHCDFLLG